jgi:hypothetical protein
LLAAVSGVQTAGTSGPFLYLASRLWGKVTRKVCSVVGCTSRAGDCHLSSVERDRSSFQTGVFLNLLLNAGCWNKSKSLVLPSCGTGHCWHMIPRESESAVRTAWCHGTLSLQRPVCTRPRWF